MRVAQRLYENGYITYMRTDSMTLSESALAAARAQVRELYGEDTVPAEPRHYERAVANAQEAHEAIRPAGDVFRTPNELRGELSRDELALYDLVLKRTVASQMKDARGQTVSLRIGATTPTDDGREFARERHRDHVPGVPQGVRARAGRADRRGRGARAPALAVGQTLPRRQRSSREGHETSPPARYTEASLVKALEDRGIGRPSTYASIMGTILDRGYVFKKGTALVPTFVAFSVRSSSSGTSTSSSTTTSRRGWRTTSTVSRPASRSASRGSPRFYFGDGDPGLHHLVTDHLDGIDARAVNSIAIPGSDIVVRVGRYGPYLERGEQRASLPDDLAPDELTRERPRSSWHSPGPSARSGRSRDGPTEIVAKDGRYGPYVTEVLPEGEDGQAADGIALLRRCRPRRSRSTTRSACSRCRERSWASTARR